MTTQSFDRIMVRVQADLKFALVPRLFRQPVRSTSPYIVQVLSGAAMYPTGLPVRVSGLHVPLVAHAC